MASVQAHSIEYLKYKRKIDKKKRRSLMNLRNHSRRIEEMFWDNDSTALFQIRLHGKFAAKLLKKFHKYNELEKTEILSLHSVMERYFVDIEQRHAEFTLKRLVLYVKLDQILRRTKYEKETNGEMSNILHAIHQFGERFDLDENMLLLLAVHCVMKNRLADIEINNDELVDRHYGLSASLTELDRPEFIDFVSFA